MVKGIFAQGESEMITRYVTRTGKDSHGNITKLCNPNEEWSPRSAKNVIKDIEDPDIDISYCSKSGKKTAPIIVVEKKDGTKYLWSVWDGSTENNLDVLPDC